MDRSGEIIEAYDALECGALIGIGGDGSLSICVGSLSKAAFP